MTTQQKDKFTPELRILAASLLSMAVILVWAKFFAPKPPVPPTQATKPGITAPAPTAADGGKPDSHMTAVPASKANPGAMSMPHAGSVSAKNDTQERSVRD